MVGRILLPSFGGAPAVWTTCVAFFQTTLLAGYLWAHASSTRFGMRRHAVAHIVLLCLALGFLPFRLGAGWSAIPTVGKNPALWLLVELAVSTALPLVLVAATSPLLQQWFTRTQHDDARDPYYLYAASNLGSLAALLAYPAVIEPRLALSTQRQLWALGYVALVILTAVCSAVVWLRGNAVSDAPIDQKIKTHTEPHGRSQWLAWVALAFVPSSWMLAVTTYLSTDIAAVPLLWVIPLAIYLVSFILVFSRHNPISVSRVRQYFPIAVMFLVAVLAAGVVYGILILLHLATFFLAAMLAHGELASRRPRASELTSFYLAVSLGGVLGGTFNAFVAPIVFDRIAEYPIAIVLACFVFASGERTQARGGEVIKQALVPLAILVLASVAFGNVGGVAASALGAAIVVLAAGLTIYVLVTARARPNRFALTIAAIILASSLSEGVNGRPLFRHRDFFGVLTVTQTADGGYRRLFHGSTLHGEQSLDPDRRAEPLTYFTRTGPIGDVFRAFRRSRAPTYVAIAGLGAGSLAAYSRREEEWTFFELDPAVVKVASDPRYFTYLRDCDARSLAIRVGDARLGVREAPDHRYGLIILDAFSSDAVPVHLLTREAIQRYRQKLAKGGMLVFNISNRYFDLDPVLGALARDAGLISRVRYDVEVSRTAKSVGKFGSIWVVMVENDADLNLIAKDPHWRRTRENARTAVWTDDYSDLFNHLLLTSWKSRIR
jgi:spermidine synthase